MSLKIENLFHAPSGPNDREDTQRLVESGTLQIERIVSHGRPSPDGFWYDQPNAEWVALLQGKATLAVADEVPIELVAGDSLLIPAHLKHRVEQVSADAVWLAVHYAE